MVRSHVESWTLLLQKDPYCANHGTLICGTCDCEDKYFGKTCNCFTGNGTQKETEKKCKA